MNTQITSKLAALAAALMMNSMLIGGVAFLFDAHSHAQSTISRQSAHLAPHLVA